jgi:hypothetical protein
MSMGWSEVAFMHSTFRYFLGPTSFWPQLKVIKRFMDVIFKFIIS